MLPTLKPRLVSPQLLAMRGRRDAIIRLTNAIHIARRREQNIAKFGVIKEFYQKQGNERQSAIERVVAHEEARKAILFLLDDPGILEIESKKEWIPDPLLSKSGVDIRWFEIKGVMRLSQDSIDKIRGLHWEERAARRKDEGGTRPRKGIYGKKRKKKKKR